MTFVAVVGGLLFPGLGHALAGRRRWAIGWAIAVPLMHGLALAVPWLFWAASAGRCVAAIQGGWFTRCAREPEWLAPVPLIVGVGGIVAMLVLRMFVIEGFMAPSSSMCPTVAVGDHVFVDKLTPRLGTIGRGDVLVFRFPCDPSRDYIKRVVGLGGDTVEMRCGVVYVNGTAVPTRLVEARAEYADRDDTTGGWTHRQCSVYAEELGGHRYHVYQDTNRPERNAHPASDFSDRQDFPDRDRGNLPPSCNSQEDFAANARGGPRGQIVITKQDAGPCELQAHFVVPADSYFVLGDNRSNSNDSRYWGTVAKEAVIGRLTSIWWSRGEHGLTWSRVGRVD